MKSNLYKNFNLNRSFTNFNSAMRYLRGKDQAAIRLDDPDFFSIPADSIDNVSALSASRRILRKRPRNKKT